MIDEYPDADIMLERWEQRLSNVKPLPIAEPSLAPKKKKAARIPLFQRPMISKRGVTIRPKLLYIITNRELQPVKVGVSDDPEKRLKSIQSGNWQRLHIHRTFRVPPNTPYHFETRIHKKLKTLHLNGEWFDIHAEDVELIAEETLGIETDFNLFVTKV